MNLQKIVSSISALFFLFSACSDALYAGALINDETNAYNISKNFSVTDSLTEQADNEILLIQDLHCHYEVQIKVAGLLKNLSDTNRLGKIYIEGSSKDIHSSFIKNLPDYIKNPLAESFLKQGKISGAEYFFLTTEKEVSLYGLEDEKLYSDNGLRLEYVLSSEREVSEIIKTMSSELKKLQKKSMSKESMRLFNLARRYNTNKISQDKYYSRLIQHAQSLEINIDAYPRVKKLSAVPKKFNYKKVNKELASFMQQAKEILPYNAYNNLIKNNNILDALSQTAEEYDINLSKYGELKKYISFHEAHFEIDVLKLYQDENNLLNEIFVKSANPEDFEITVLSLSFEKFKNYAVNKATDDDFRYINDFGLEYFEKLWNKYADRELLNSLMPHLAVYKNYHETNDKRNEAFAQRVNAGPETTVVITGGFHTEELKKMLSDRNFAVRVLTPRINEGIDKAEEKYAKLFGMQSSGRDADAFLENYALKAFLSYGEKTNLIESLSEINALYIRGEFKEKKLDDIVSDIIAVYNASAGENENILLKSVSQTKNSFKAILSAQENEVALIFKKNGDVQADYAESLEMPPAAIFYKAYNALIKKPVITAKEKFILLISDPFTAPVWETAYIFALTTFLGPAAALLIFTASHILADIILDENPREVILSIKENPVKYLKLLLPAAAFIAPFISALPFAGAFAVSFLAHEGYNAFAQSFPKYNLPYAIISNRMNKRIKVYAYEEDAGGIPVCRDENLITSSLKISMEQYREKYSGQKMLLSTKLDSRGNLNILQKKHLIFLNDSSMAGKEAIAAIDENCFITEVYIMTSNETIKYVNANMENPENPNMQLPLEKAERPTVISEYQTEKGKAVPGKILNYFSKLTTVKYKELFSGRKIILQTQADSNGSLSLFGKSSIVGGLKPHSTVTVILDEDANITEIYAETENGPQKYVNANRESDEQINMQIPFEELETSTAIYEYAAGTDGFPVIKESGRLNYFQYALPRPKYDGLYSGRKVILATNVSLKGSLYVFGNQLLHRPKLSMAPALVIVNEKGHITDIYILNVEETLKFTNANKTNPENPNMQPSDKAHSVIYRYSGKDKDGLPAIMPDTELTSFVLFAKERYENDFLGIKTVVTANFSPSGSLTMLGYKNLIYNTSLAGKSARAVVNEYGYIMEIYVQDDDEIIKYVNANLENPKDANMQQETIKSDNFIEIYAYDGLESNTIPRILPQNKLNTVSSIQNKTYLQLYGGRETVLITKVDKKGNVYILGHSALVSRIEFAGEEARIVMDKNGNIKEVYLISDDGTRIAKFINTNNEDPSQPRMKPPAEDLSNAQVIYAYSGMEKGLLPRLNKEKILDYFPALSKKTYDDNFSGTKTVIAVKVSPSGNLSAMGYRTLLSNPDFAGKETRIIVNEKGHITELYIIGDGNIIKYVNANTENPENANMQIFSEEINDFSFVYEYTGMSENIPIIRKRLNYFKIMTKEKYKELYSGRKTVVFTRFNSSGGLSILGHNNIIRDAPYNAGREARIVLDEKCNITELYIITEYRVDKYVNVNKINPDKLNMQRAEEKPENFTAVYLYDSINDNGAPVLNEEKRKNYGKSLSKQDYDDAFKGKKTVIVSKLKRSGLHILGYKSLIYVSAPEFSGAETRTIVNKDGHIEAIYVMKTDSFIKYVNANTENPGSPNMQRLFENIKNPTSVYAFEGISDGMPVKGKRLNYYQVLNKFVYDASYLNRETVLSLKFSSDGRLNLMGYHNLIIAKKYANLEANIVIDRQGHITDTYVLSPDGPVRYTNLNEGTGTPDMKPLFENIEKPITVYEYSGMENGVPSTAETKRIGYFEKRLPKIQFNKAYSDKTIVLTYYLDNSGSLSILGHLGLLQTNSSDMAGRETRVLIENGYIKEAYIITETGYIKYINANKKDNENPNMQLPIENIEKPLVIYEYSGMKDGIPEISEKTELNYFSTVIRDTYRKLYSGTSTVIVTKTSDIGTLYFMGHEIKGFAVSKEARIIMNKDAAVSEIYIITDDGPVKYVNANFEHPENPNFQPSLETAANPKILYAYSGMEYGIPVKKGMLNYFEKLPKDKYDELYSDRKILLSVKPDKTGGISFFGNTIIQSSPECKEVLIVIENGYIKSSFEIFNDGSVVRRINMAKDSQTRPVMRLDFKNKIEGDFVDNIISYIYALEFLEANSYSKAKFKELATLEYRVTSLDKHFRLWAVKEKDFVYINGVKMKVVAINHRARSMTVEYDALHSDREVTGSIVTIETTDIPELVAKREFLEKILKEMDENSADGYALNDMFRKTVKKESRNSYIPLEEAGTTGVMEILKKRQGKALFVNAFEDKEIDAMITKAATKLAKKGKKVLIMSASGKTLDTLSKQFYGDYETPFLRIFDGTGSDSKVNTLFGSNTLSARKAFFNKIENSANEKGFVIASKKASFDKNDHSAQVLSPLMKNNGFDAIFIITDGNLIDTMAALQQLSKNGEVIFVSKGKKAYDDHGEKDAELLKQIQQEENEFIDIDIEAIMHMFEDDDISIILPGKINSNTITINPHNYSSSIKRGLNFWDFISSHNDAEMEKYLISGSEKISTLKDFLLFSCLYGILEQNLSSQNIEKLKERASVFKSTFNISNLSETDKTKYLTALGIFEGKPENVLESDDLEAAFLKIISAKAAGNDEAAKIMIDSLKNRTENANTHKALLVLSQIMPPPTKPYNASGREKFINKPNTALTQALLSSS